MGKAEIKKGVSLATALCQDIGGNLLSGNDVRAMGYVKALRAVLAATQGMIDAGSDVRKELDFVKKVEEVLAQLDKEHAEHPFDNSRMQESVEKFNAAGYSFSDFSSGVHIDDLIKAAAAR